MHYLYRITNTENKKVYIGQTNNPSLRWSQHRSNAKYDRGNQVITRAITKYGADAFEFDEIAGCLTQESADIIEEQLIAQYNSRNPNKGYNVAASGNTTPRTPELLKKISDGLNKFYETNDGWNKGGTLTEEWKNKISQSHIGLPGTNNGKTFDDEWRLNISKAQAGKDQKSKRRFFEEIEKEICRLYVEEEKSMYALGQQFDCQRTLIADILQRNNIETRKSNYTGHSNGRNIFTQEQEKEICDLYMTGNVNKRKLAEQFGCGKTTIRNILIKYNIKL